MYCRLSSLRVYFIAVALLFASVSPGAAKDSCVLRVGWGDWPPYIFFQDGKFHGLEYELLTSTAKAAGCEIKMMDVPWVRAQLMLKARKLDLLYGAGYSPERAEYAKFSDPYRTEQFVLVTKAGADDEPKSVSLNTWIRSKKPKNKPRIVGVFRGDFYGEKMDSIFKSNTKHLRLIELSQNKQMIEMLDAGRLDGFIIEDAVARMEIQTSTVPMRRFVIEEQVADPLHYMFSLDIADDVIGRFNAAIQRRLSSK